MTNHHDIKLGLQDNTEVLHRISNRLAVRFAGIFAAETVERYVFESYAALARSAKITAYLPATAEHFANDRLRALAKSKNEASFASGTPEVLFVCVQNAGRSQMAAALVNVEAKGRVHVRSAGSMPAPDLDSAVVTAMAEMGVDLTKDYPKPTSCGHRMWSSLWAAAIPAQSTRANDMKTGTCLTPLTNPSKQSAPSATRFMAASGPSCPPC